MVAKPIRDSNLSQTLHPIEILTSGPGFINITAKVETWLRTQNAQNGLLTCFIQHTSASLTIQENADPDVCTDLMTSLDHFAPQSASYLHNTEGPDDMPAHIKSMLTQTSLSIPVGAGAPLLGTWQGIYLIEHRTAPHRRHIQLHFLGTFKPEE